MIGRGEAVERAARTLADVASSWEAMGALRDEIRAARAAEARGYFLPDEDERVRDTFARYLVGRAALFATIGELRPHLPPLWRRASPSADVRAFAVSLAAAGLLVRSARLLVARSEDLPVVRRKLDEAESRFGIPPKQFTAVYRSLTRPAHVFQLFQALAWFDRNRAPFDRLRGGERFAPVLGVFDEVLGSLRTLRRREFARGRARYLGHASLRRIRSAGERVVFSAFETSGRAISEMRLPFRRKRVTPTIGRRLGRLLEPGDVIVTRHDDAMSNLFLPGFWPHGALYIGSDQQRAELGMDERFGEGCRVLEARKDGVRVRTLEETLSVDACCVIRPRIPREVLPVALARALSHRGKGYDFEFDFTRADRLVCTEVVYRGFHGVGGMAFTLKPRAGRLCLPAQDLLDDALEGRNFEPVAVFGTRGRNFVTGPAAREALAESYREHPA